MSRSKLKYLAILPLAALFAGAADAQSERDYDYPAPRGWDQLAHAKKGECEAQVSSNLFRNIFVISANGFDPSEIGVITHYSDSIAQVQIQPPPPEDDSGSKTSSSFGRKRTLGETEEYEPRGFVVPLGFDFPIERDIIANQYGHYVDVYVPFGWNPVRGTATVNIASRRCNLTLTFAWRQGIPIIDSDGSTTYEYSD